MRECTSNDNHHRPRNDILSDSSHRVYPSAHGDQIRGYLEALVTFLSRDLLDRWQWVDRLSTDDSLGSSQEDPLLKHLT